jgi:hypothetical protein
MFVSPFLMFASAVWVLGFAALGLYLLFRPQPAGIPATWRDRMAAFTAMMLIGVLGAAAAIATALFIDELF